MNKEIFYRLGVIVKLLNAIYNKEYQYVERILEDFNEVFYPRFGLCQNVYHNVLQHYYDAPLNSKYSSFGKWVIEKHGLWELNSTDNCNFPVEGDFDAYEYNLNKYNGEYGVKRRKLAKYMAECIEKELLS